MLKKLRIGGQFAPVRILRNVCYDSAFELSTDISGAESCCAGLVSLSGQVIESCICFTRCCCAGLVSLSGQGDRTSCSCAEEAD